MVALVYSSVRLTYQALCWHSCGLLVAIRTSSQSKYCSVSKVHVMFGDTSSRPGFGFKITILVKLLFLRHYVTSDYAIEICYFTE